jgi:hypothetical protein
MTNHELNNLTGGANIVRFTRAQRLKWRGQLHTMEEYRMEWRIFEWSPIAEIKRTPKE